MEKPEVKDTPESSSFFKTYRSKKIPIFSMSFIISIVLYVLSRGEFKDIVIVLANILGSTIGLWLLTFILSFVSYIFNYKKNNKGKIQFKFFLIIWIIIVVLQIYRSISYLFLFN